MRADATPEGSEDAETIRVPQDAATLADAADRVGPGGTIVIAPGIYAEELVIDTPDVTVRGEDRNGTVIDGGGLRPYGIVVIADGVRVENLTVTGATFYGVLFTGLHDENGPSAPTATGYEPWDPAQFPPLQRFLVDHVTAYNNGLYGIYAFNAQHGVIRDSYASGSADSGFYVGQCEDCDILVTGNVAERNAVGFENANASDIGRHRRQPLLGQPRRNDAAVELPGGIHAAAQQRRRRQSADRQRRSRLPRAGRGRLRYGSGTERRTGQHVRAQPDRRQSSGRGHP